MIWWARFVVFVVPAVAVVILVALVAARGVELLVPKILAPVYLRERRYGEPDDTLRMQEAVSRASKRWFHRRRVVSVPKGNYYISSDVNFTGDVSVRGES